MNANQTYLELLTDLISGPQFQVSPRKQQTREIVCHRTTIDMASCIMTIRDRDLDYRFMAAEARWILAGENKLDHPVLMNNLVKYSDDGTKMYGAYGPSFVEQVEYVMAALRSDLDTRQATMTLWTRNPVASKDIPCTVALQWLIRDEYLHCNVFMRSSDAWLGWPYDVFNFTMMSIRVLFGLPQGIQLGQLNLIAGSQHLYVRNLDSASTLVRQSGGGDILTIDTQRIGNPDSLMSRLDNIRNASDNEVAFHLMKAELCR